MHIPWNIASQISLHSQEMYYKMHYRSALSFKEAGNTQSYSTL